MLCLGPEDMSVRECCYYLTVSMTTVGYGDVAPTTVGGKLFMMPYTLIGLAVCFPIARDAGEVVHKWLEQARSCAPCIVFLDELDCRSA